MRLISLKHFTASTYFWAAEVFARSKVNVVSMNGEDDDGEEGEEEELRARNKGNASEMDAARKNKRRHRPLFRDAQQRPTLSALLTRYQLQERGCVC